MKRCIVAALVLAVSVSAGNDDRYDSGRGRDYDRDRDYDRGRNNNNDNGSASAFGIGALAGIGAGVINGASGTAAGIGAGLGLGIGGVNVNNGGSDKDKHNSGSNNGGLLGGLLGGNDKNNGGTTLSGIGIGAGIGIGIGAVKADSGNNNGDDDHDCPVGQTYRYGKCRCPDDSEWNGSRCVPVAGDIVCTGGDVKNGQCVCRDEDYVPMKQEGLKNCYTCVAKCEGGDWTGGFAIPSGANSGQCVCPNTMNANTQKIPIFFADDCRYVCSPQCINPGTPVIAQTEPANSPLIPRPGPGPCTCADDYISVALGNGQYECRERCEGGTWDPPTGGGAGYGTCRCTVAQTTIFTVSTENRQICVPICDGGSVQPGVAGASRCDCTNGRVADENEDYPGTFTCKCPEGQRYFGNQCIAPNNCAGLYCHPVGSSGTCPENMRRVGDDCECPLDCEWRDNKCHRRSNSVIDSSRGSDSRRNYDSGSNRNNNNNSGNGLSFGGIGIGVGAGIGLGVINASQGDGRSGRNDHHYSAGHVQNTMQVPPSVPHLFDPMTGQPIGAPGAPSAPITAPSAPAPVSPVGPVGSATAACASGFKQCTLAQPEGPTTYCYNPQVYACVKVASGSSLICPANANAACGNGCYDPTQFACKDGVVVAH